VWAKFAFFREISWVSTAGAGLDAGDNIDKRTIQVIDTLALVTAVILKVLTFCNAVIPTTA
jgi:hypothetical protein